MLRSICWLKPSRAWHSRSQLSFVSTNSSRLENCFATFGSRRGLLRRNAWIRDFMLNTAAGVRWMMPWNDVAAPTLAGLAFQVYVPLSKIQLGEAAAP